MAIDIDRLYQKPSPTQNSSLCCWSAASIGADFYSQFPFSIPWPRRQIVFIVNCS